MAAYAILALFLLVVKERAFLILEFLNLYNLATSVFVSDFTSFLVSVAVVMVNPHFDGFNLNLLGIVLCLGSYSEKDDEDDCYDCFHDLFCYIMITVTSVF